MVEYAKYPIVACYHPLKGYRRAEGGITFQRSASLTGEALSVPCGQCVGCRLEKSRQWAMRCMHEARLWRDNYFVTLTYGDEFLPPGGTLVKRDFQLFMKRLRFAVGNGVRFYGCGEYGDINRRPHYHVLLFNCPLGELLFHSKNGRGDAIYTSELLRELWTTGFHFVGNVSFDSAAYVARYCLKKITGEGSEAAYEVVDRFGVVWTREREFSLMSRRPGIGRGYYDKYGSELRAHDNVIVNKRAVGVPRYYDTLTERLYGDALLHEIKLKRKRKGFKFAHDRTPERLAVRERVVQLGLERKRERTT